jgi:hypothetical protein
MCCENKEQITYTFMEARNIVGNIQ